MDHPGWRMLVVLVTFCIRGSLSLPIYPFATLPAPAYVPAIDPYGVPYPSVDPYASSPPPYLSQPASPVYVPSVDAYYQVPVPDSAYPQPAPSPYPSVDPYQAYPQQSPYPSADPYQAYPLPAPYPAVDPYQAYPLPAPYPAVDPYQAYPQQSPYPSPVDPYQAYPLPAPYPSVSSVAPAYNPAPAAQNYPLAPSISQYVAPIQQQAPPVVDLYGAITYHELKDRLHCGVLAATNDDIYSSPVPGSVNDVVPFGKYPWLQLLVNNDDNTVVCIATRLHVGLSLVPSSCLNGPASKYSLITDWDILTIYNQYEAYKSSSTAVCTMWPLGWDNSSAPLQYTLGGNNADLTLLATVDDEDLDKLAHLKVICLPYRSSLLPPPYSYQQYQQPTSPYGYPPQQPQLPYAPYPQIASSNPYPTPSSKSDCWVFGYRYSPTAVLQNHPLPQPADNSQQSPVQQQYYDSIDNSKVPRRASIRQIQCPAGYPNPGANPYDDVCFVGVNGYDACVADKGSSIFCIVDDSNDYQSGFSDDPTSDHGAVSPPPNSQPNYPPYQPQQQKPPIQAAPAQPKGNRQRAVLYAINKVPTTCSSPQYQQQSNYIVGTRVSPDIRAAIVDFNWMNAYDETCSAEKLGDVVSAPANSAYPPPYPPPSPYAPYQATSLQPQYYDPSINSADPYAQPVQYQPSPQYQQQPLYPPPAPLVLPIQPYQDPSAVSYNSPYLPFLQYPQDLYNVV